MHCHSFRNTRPVTERHSAVSTSIIIFTDARPLPGAECLAYSLRKHNPTSDYRIILLSDCPDVLKSRRLKELTDEQRFVNADKYKSIRPEKAHWGRKAFMKAFEAFRDYGSDRNVLLDADILCLDELQPLFEESDYDLRVVRDIHDRLRKSGLGDRDEFNSGMMVIHRRLMSDATVAELIQFAAGRKSYDGGDEGIMNLWACEKRLRVEYLPDAFNLLKVVARRRFGSGVIGRLAGECRLLHYHTHKPWGVRNESRYRSLNRLWHDVYQEMRETLNTAVSAEHRDMNSATEDLL